MFQKLKNLQSEDYQEKAWYSGRIRELVDGGMKKKDALKQLSVEMKNKPWEKRSD